MPTIEEIRRLNPRALDIYKQQAYKQALSGDPYFSRLVQSPEYQSVMGMPKRPWWQHPLDWMRGVEKGAGAFLTAPFTPRVAGTENLPWFEREKAEYESWDEPSFETQPLFRLPWTSEEIRAKPWTIGVKGAVEQVPWFATTIASGGLGAMGWAGRTAGIKGLQTAAQVGAKALKPIQTLEALPAKLAVKGIKTAVKPLIPKEAQIIPDLQDINQAIEIASRPDNLRKVAAIKPFEGISRLLGGRSAVMKTADEKAVVGRQILLAEGETKTVAVMARLKQLGNQEAVFGKIGKDGKFVSGEVEGILQNELFTYPDKYIAKLNPTQRHWIEIASEIEKAKLAFLKRNRIKVNELKFEEGGVYAGQRVAGKFNKEGMLEDIAYISPGARKPGTKPSFLKTRIFDNPEEAASLGYRYLARDDALFLNVQAAYNFVSNKKMTDWLLDRISYRTAGATELTKAQRLSQIVRAMKKGKTPSIEKLRLVSKEYPDIAKRLRTASGAELDELFAEAEGVLQKAQLEWNALTRTEQTAVRAYARTPRLGEARVQAPAFQGKILTGEDAPRIAELLNKEFNPSYSEALGAVNRINAVGRYFALSGDMSPFGIQLIFMPWTYPKAYAESVKGFLKALADKDFLPNYIARNVDIINGSPGLLISAFEPTEAMRASGILARLPGVRTVFEPFTRGYDTAMTIAGVEMKKALKGLAITAEKNADIDAFINEFRGLISTARLGILNTQRQGESMLLLAPKYNRAVISLLADAFKSGTRGVLARDALLKGITGISALSVAFSYAIGEDEEDIIQHLNPRSPKFLTWQIAGQNIGPGSKVRSILKLIGDSTKDPEDLFTLSMENPGLRFLRGNMAPVVSTGMDLLTGRNYIGDPTRDGMLNLTKTVIGENLVPIWVQSVIWEGGELGEVGLRGGVEFLGGRAYPMTPYQEYEETRNTIAQKAYGMDWDSVGQNLGEMSQLMLERDNPEIRRLKEVAQKESAKMARGQSVIWDRWNQGGVSIEERYRRSVTLASQEYERTMDGSTFRDKIDDASLVRREMYDQRQRLPEFAPLVQSFNQPLSAEQMAKMNPLDMARREYFTAMYSPDMYDRYGNYLFDLAEQREKDFERQYGQDALEYIHSFGGVRWEEPMAMKVLREARRTLEPYWEIETQIWSQYPPELQQIARQIDIMDRTDPGQADRMLFQYPQIVFIRKMIASQKKALKAMRPDIAQALRTFYTY